MCQNYEKSLVKKSPNQSITTLIGQYALAISRKNQ